MNRTQRIDNYINSPLFKLAETKLIRERKFNQIGKHKFADENLIILQMSEIVSKAHKQGQKELLDNFLKGDISNVTEF